MMLVNSPGIYRMSHADYLAGACEQPALSSSIIKILWESTPLHAFLEHPRLNPNYHDDEPDERLDLGTIAHALLLEKDESNLAIINPELYPAKNGNIPSGFTNNAIRAARDEARAAGKIPVLPDQMRGLHCIADAARKFLAREDCELKGILEDSRAEETWILKTEEGIWYKARPDLVSNDDAVLCDYKTSTSANPEQFVRSIFSYGYDIQSALYLWIHKQLTGKDAQFVFLVQEIYPPHACSLVGAGPSVIESGMSKVMYAITSWRQCMKSGEWPGYTGRVHWSESPAWEVSRMEEKLINAGGTI